MLSMSRISTRPDGTAVAFPAVRPATPRPAYGWAVIGVLCAVAIGVIATWNPQIGAGLLVAGALAIAVMRSPAMLLPILVATPFVEMIDIGGVRITRLLAPAALLVVIVCLTRGQRIQPGPPLFWVCGYALWALASGLWTVSTDGTLTLLASLAIALVYMLAIALLVETRRDLNRMLWTLAVCSFVLSVSSILAFLDKPFGPLGATIQEGRVQGATGDPSFFAAVQLVALPLILVLASAVSNSWLRAALYFTAVLDIAAVFSTTSRGGFLQLIVVFLLLLVFPARRIFGSPTSKAIALLVIVLGGLAFFSRYSVDIAPRLETIMSQGGGGADQTGSGRLIIWPAAWMAFEERPFTGIGYGAFRETAIDRLYKTRNTYLGNFKVHKEEVHNAFLGSLAELGLVGLLLFIGVLASAARTLFRIAARARRLGEYFVERVANALVIGICGWCVGSLFISTETSRPIWIVVGLSLALPKLLREEVEDEAADDGAQARARVSPPASTNGAP
jgi:O-antigen ligase